MNTDPATTDVHLCPQCKCVIPFDARTRLWCPKCNWNVGVPTPNSWRDTRLNAVLTKVSERRSDELFRVLTERPQALHTRSVSWGAVLLATFVNLFLVGWFSLGVLLFRWSHAWPVVGMSAFFCFTAVSVIPRPWKVPKDAVILTKSELPKTFELVDRVSNELKLRSPKRIILTSEFNAAAAVGRRGRTLVLGLPMVFALTSAQLVSVLGHELGHYANRNVLRHGFVNTALGALRGAFSFLSDRRSSPIGGFAGDLGHAAFFAIRWVFSWPILWLLLGLHVLDFRRSQIAEFRCDELGALVGGTDAAVGMLASIELATSVELVIQRMMSPARLSKNPDDKVDIWGEIRRHVSGMPATEAMRLLRVSSMPGRATNMTHPPTGHRVSVLEKAPKRYASVVLSESHHHLLSAELSIAGFPVACNIADSYGFPANRLSLSRSADLR